MASASCIWPCTAIAATFLFARVLLLPSPLRTRSEQTSQLVRNEGPAMSVAPTGTPRILDRRPLGLVPIVLIAAFSWQWAMAQTGGGPDSPPGHFSDIEPQGGYAQVKDLRFTHLTTNDGLSQSNVR